jgi:hypothetical protein
MGPRDIPAAPALIEWRPLIRGPKKTAGEERHALRIPDHGRDDETGGAVIAGEVAEHTLDTARLEFGSVLIRADPTATLSLNKMARGARGEIGCCSDVGSAAQDRTGGFPQPHDLVPLLKCNKAGARC